MINVTNLSRRYGNFTAVDQVSFQIGCGEIVGLLGHNGAGKSTIMKMLTGFLEPSGGEIRIAGETLLADRCGAQARIGYACAAVGVALKEKQTIVVGGIGIFWFVPQAMFHFFGEAFGGMFGLFLSGLAIVGLAIWLGRRKEAL